LRREGEIPSSKRKKKNFRAALEQFFQGCTEGNLVIETKASGKSFISTCSALFENGQLIGSGHSSTQEGSVQCASLDLLLKLGLNY